MLKFLSTHLTIFCLISLIFITGFNSAVKTYPQKFIHEIETSMKSDILDAWYPVSLDNKYGGFLSDLNYKWELDGRQNKMLVTQTRHVWTTSKAAMYYNDKKYLKIAEHGFKFLHDKMWDETYGGFYMYRIGGYKPKD